MTTTEEWFLMKHDDNSTFGPVPFDQLKEWAMSAQISPLDKVSNDETNWQKAPMIPQLEMDWLAQVSDDQYYGPTSIGAVEEFLRLGEITMDTLLINCCDGTERKVRDVPMLNLDQLVVEKGEEPGKTGIRQNLQERIRELEEIILEERRAREVISERYRKLEAQYVAQTGKQP